ncbi:MAG: hypothetical protein ACI8RZ_005321 [Myxococcota bacterium]|jgi:hypothetical protein
MTGAKKNHQPIHQLTLDGGSIKQEATVLWWGLNVVGAEGFVFGADPAAWLDQSTVLSVDVIDPALETFYWDGTGTATFTSPDGTSSIKLDPQEFANQWEVDQVGTWEVTLSATQVTGFDIQVLEYYDIDGNGALDEYLGRLSSTRWEITIAAGQSVAGAMYIVAPLYEGSATAEVYYTSFEGFAGDTLTAMANRLGSTDLPAWSTPYAFAEPEPEYRLYLNPPEDVTLANTTTPDDPELEVTTDPSMCDSILYGTTKAIFSMQISEPSAGVLVCDLDNDGVFSMSGGTDLALYDWYSAGADTIVWDGTDASGALVAPGEYVCTLRLLSAPVHFLLRGLSTAAPGVALLGTNADGTLRSRPMQWNDRLLVDAVGTDADLSSTGAPPLVSTEGEGVYSDTSLTLVPDDSAHGWGNFADTSRGDQGWVDTWTFSDSLTAADSPVVRVLSPSDDDGDGLIGGIEDCQLGTNPDNADTDNDGLDDGTEVGDLNNPLDTDGDLMIDALDEDDDNDGVKTAEEITDTAAHDLPADLDGDTLDSWHDTDADGDGWADGEELDDLNGDGLPAYLDPNEYPEEDGWSGFDDRSPEPIIEAILSGTFRGGVGACAVTAPRPLVLPLVLTLLGVVLRRRGSRMLKA